MKKYLRETKMLDYSSKNIQQLIRERNWNDIEEFERLKSIYTFVRDEILFGYNIDDTVCASKVLAGYYAYGEENGFTIDKELQKGAMPLARTMYLQNTLQPSYAAHFEVHFYIQFLSLLPFAILYQW